MQLREEDIRRHSRTLLLRSVGGRGLSTLLLCRVRFLGGGALLESAALFASRAGVVRAEAPPFHLTVAADETGSLDLDAADPAVAAISGRRGVAIVVLSRDAVPCPRCRLARARVAAGAPGEARGSLALAAGACVASLALCVALELDARSGATIAYFGADSPLPESIGLSCLPGCACAASGATP